MVVGSGDAGWWSLVSRSTKLSRTMDGASVFTGVFTGTAEMSEAQ